MIDVDQAVLFAVVGVVMLVAALLPNLLSRAPLSMPMVFLGAGALCWSLIPALPDPDPVTHNSWALPLTEITVIVALMGAGLALNRPFALRTWSSTARLLAIAMPITMLAVGLLGWSAMGLGVASAVLIAAAVAPTDPVLASEVQVGEPDEDPEADDEARFSLTSEAGLNDGLAFPFTLAAIAISAVGVTPDAWLGRWLLVDVVWRVAGGVIVGVAIGWVLGKLFFTKSRMRLADRSEGFVALAATFLAYGVAELIETYGFVAVFVCACSIRAQERHHGYHWVLHNFVEQIERLLTVAVILLLGGAVARGLLGPLSWVDIAVGLALVLVIRPVAAWVSLSPGKTGPRERAVISFFGVRGIGSLFYVAYALQHGAFPDAERLWAFVGLVVVASVVVHGISAAPSMTLLDLARRRAAKRRGGEESDVATTPV